MTAPRSQQTYKVYTKQKWSDPWEETADVYCDRFSLVAAPDVAEATLHFNYGRVAGANVTGFTTRERKEKWGGRYVKIALTQGKDEEGKDTFRNWIGVILAPADSRAGTLNIEIDGDDEQIETGRQTFHCRGLEFLLERTIVDTAIVETKDGSEQRVNRAIAFNFGQGRDADHIRVGNRGKMGERDAPIFPFHLEGAPEWTVSDIVNYLLAYQLPTNAEGHDVIDWQSPNTDDAKILDALEPTAHAHGKNVKAILDGLIDRRRLVGWNVTIDVSAEEGERPRIDVFTFNATEITLPSGKAIPPNPDRVTWNFDQDVNIVSNVLLDDDATRYDQVIARGHPLGACFTIGDAREHSVVEDWNPSLESTYIVGGTDSGAYAAAIDDWTKYKVIEEARRDPKFHKVFRYFRLSDQFAGELASQPVCPDPDEPNLATAFWFPGLKFHDKLPLLTEHDYETVDPADIVDHTITSSFPEYLRPYALIDSGSGVFVFLDATSRGRDLTDETLKCGGESWSASLKMQDHAPGFIITTTAPQHVLGEFEFEPVNAIDAERWPAELNWRTIVCTVFCEFDQQAEAKYPQDVSGVTADFLRRLVINVPNARLDYLAPNTVIGIKPDGALKTSSGGYVRDDRNLLKDIARSAFGWYGQTRRALTVVQRNLVTDRQIGQLITTIGEAGTEINSVVTKLEFDLREGTVMVQTQFGQFDPQNLGP